MRRDPTTWIAFDHSGAKPTPVTVARVRLIHQPSTVKGLYRQSDLYGFSFYVTVFWTDDAVHPWEGRYRTFKDANAVLKMFCVRGELSEADDESDARTHAEASTEESEDTTDDTSLGGGDDDDTF